MEGIINNKGLLGIVRGKVPTAQACPFAMTTLDCGDWCPLFGEPYPETDWDPKSSAMVEIPTGRINLELCQKTLVFDTLTDER